MRNVVLACCMFVLATPIYAQTLPGPSDATANDRSPGAAVAADQNASMLAAPADTRALRHWLLARLIVDRNLNGEQASVVEQKLANVSDDQLDVVLRVYQQKHSQQEAAAQTELELAKENLDQLKNYRDAAANELTSWRAYRQAQYLNFGYRPGGYPYAGSPNGFGGYPNGYGVGMYPNMAAPYMTQPFYSGYSAPMYGAPYPMYGGAGLGFGVGIY